MEKEYIIGKSVIAELDKKEHENLHNKEGKRCTKK